MAPHCIKGTKGRGANPWRCPNVGCVEPPERREKSEIKQQGGSHGVGLRRCAMPTQPGGWVGGAIENRVWLKLCVGNVRVNARCMRCGVCIQRAQTNVVCVWGRHARSERNAYVV